MKYGSLFSGIGGMDLGLDRAGMECAWQVEIDEWCRKVLTKHWPDVPKFGDIKELSGEELEPVDLIAGGFPCQPVSIGASNRRLFQEDERWLWPEFWRIACLLRPTYILVENVPGLFDGGIEQVLGELAEGGYDTDWSVVSACSVGAPHLRKRVFILAYPYSDGLERVERPSVPTSSEHLASSPAHNGVGDEDYWDKQLPQSFVRGMVDGVPHRVDRLRGLGNAVVPQVAEFIGKRIMESRASC